MIAEWWNAKMEGFQNRLLPNDGLWQLRVLSVDLYFSTFARILKKILLIYNVLLYGVEIWYIYSQKQGSNDLDLLNYAPFLFSSIFPTITIVASFSYYGTVIQPLKQTIRHHFWAISEQSRLDLARISRNLVACIFVSLLFVVALPYTGLSPWHLNRSATETVLIIRIFNETLTGTWRESMHIVYWLSLIPSFYSMVAAAVAILYFVYHFELQFRMLGEAFDRLESEQQTTREVDLVRSEKYQEKVWQSLRSYTDFYVSLSRSFKRIMHALSIWITLFVLTGGVVSVNVIFFMLNVMETSSSWSVKATGVVSVFALLLFVTLYCIGSQVAKDLNEMVLDAAARAPWHLWCGKNRRALTMFMLYCKKPMAFALSATSLTVDYAFLLSFMKMSYSVAAILYRVRRNS